MWSRAACTLVPWALGSPSQLFFDCCYLLTLFPPPLVWLLPEGRAGQGTHPGVCIKDVTGPSGCLVNVFEQGIWAGRRLMVD